MDVLQILIPILYSAIILLATWVVAKLAMTILRRLMVQDTSLVYTQIQRLVWLLVWLVGLILAVEQLGINSNILLLVVGLLGVAVIAAIREPLENIGARYFTHGYIPFKVGDTITIKEHAGKIIEMNAMSVILLTHNNHIVSIPNSTFMKEVVVNTTPQAWKSVEVSMVVKNGVDLPAFENAVLKSLNKLRQHFDDRFPPILTIVSRDRKSTELALNIMIQRPEERDTIITEVKKRVAEIIDLMQNAKKNRWGL